MMDVVEHLWNKAEPVFFITKEDFVQNLSKWITLIHHVDGVAAFISIVNGPEFHFESLETGHPLTRKMIKDFLKPIIEQHGYAITRTPMEDEKQQRFNLLLGFKEVGRDEYDVIYRIERIRGCL